MKRRVAPKALDAMKERVREITDRNRGRSMGSVIQELRRNLMGWKEYYKRERRTCSEASTPGSAIACER